MLTESPWPLTNVKLPEGSVEGDAVEAASLAPSTNTWNGLPVTSAGSQTLPACRAQRAVPAKSSAPSITTGWLAVPMDWSTSGLPERPEAGTVARHGEEAAQTW